MPWNRKKVKTSERRYEDAASCGSHFGFSYCSMHTASCYQCKLIRIKKHCHQTSRRIEFCIRIKIRKLTGLSCQGFLFYVVIICYLNKLVIINKRTQILSKVTVLVGLWITTIPIVARWGCFMSDVWLIYQILVARMNQAFISWSQQDSVGYIKIRKYLFCDH